MKLSLGQKILLWLSLAMLVTNPVTGMVVLQAIDWAFAQAFSYGGYVGVITTSYLVGYLLLLNHRSQKVKLPAKADKTSKAGQYIVT